MSERLTQEKTQRDLSKVNFVVAKREFPWQLKKEVKAEQNFTCQGIDDKYGLPICILEIIGIGGKHVPASEHLGFNIDISHYSHNSNSDFYFTKDAVRCQCKACHLFYTQGIGNYGSVKKINGHEVYKPNARALNAKYELGLDLSLKKPKVVLEVLTQHLHDAGVVWEYGKEVVFTKPWNGVGTQEQIADIAKRLYAPKPIDKMIWDMDARRAEEAGVIYEAPKDINWAEYHGIK